ncbi:GNAT family protein [Neobacillus sp. PS3-12]|uniref:GNAT family N-acetyltransferase n=1 Tax=Neobacillus sp. PS3-12 TaxID=3070677 RepID=UPI0027E0421C|nr:GNAT family protein [Neobacillus sp. PS3-12]WML54785.1 GNAT family protein [Neobacillus sp. PS3-12]
MVHLRKLQLKDAEGMLEWMHDSELMKNFRFDASNMTRQKVELFINNSHHDDVNYHFAIASEKDEYLGTISLKNIDLDSRNGEYAIALRRTAIGTGAALEATKLLLSKAFFELMLEKVYLNVLTNNKRAIRFYEKSGFVKEGVFKKHVFAHQQLNDLSWYAIFKEGHVNEKI